MMNEFLEYLFESYDRYYNGHIFHEEVKNIIKNSENIWINYDAKILLIRFSGGYYKLDISRQLSDLRTSKINTILDENN